MNLLTLAPELNMPSDVLQKIQVDVAVLKTQMTELKDSMNRVETFLTENGLTERIVKSESRIEELMKLKTWMFWILGTIGVGVIVNFVRLTTTK